MVMGSSSVDTKDIVVTNSIYGGGNAARIGGNTYVHVSGSTVNNSVYAGGNGQTAITLGNTSLDIDNNANINKHVFGGGNAAATGSLERNNSLGNVNIVSANIGGNVYGGANTSFLYGETIVNVGKMFLLIKILFLVILVFLVRYLAVVKLTLVVVKNMIIHLLV